jgi:hypothetical protein
MRAPGFSDRYLAGVPARTREALIALDGEAVLWRRAGAGKREWRALRNHRRKDLRGKKEFALQ